MKLVASTGRTYSEGQTHNAGSGSSTSNNVFRYAQWTPDGSSVITVNEDRGVRLFVVPPDILDDNDMIKPLVPYKCKFLPSPILSVSIHPQFNLQQYNTLYTAISTRDVPVRLYNISEPNSASPLSYGLLCNDEYLPVYSTSFVQEGSLLSVGSKKTYALFDINRPGTMALLIIPIKGIISTMAHDPIDAFSSVVGKFDGSVALLDLRSGSITEQLSPPLHTSANMQLIWAPSSLYIFQVCRNSREIHILDPRMSLKSVGSLVEWAGMTNQRLGISVTKEGHIYGGGTNGEISVWDSTVDMTPSLTFSAHESCVTCVSMNPLESASVLASCSGTRDDDTTDCSLKIWDLRSSTKT